MNNNDATVPSRMADEALIRSIAPWIPSSRLPVFVVPFFF
jgi:hypothetical protein